MENSRKYSLKNSKLDVPLEIRFYFIRQSVFLCIYLPPISMVIMHLWSEYDNLKLLFNFFPHCFTSTNLKKVGYLKYNLIFILISYGIFLNLVLGWKKCEISKNNYDHMPHRILKKRAIAYDQQNAEFQ